MKKFIFVGNRFYVLQKMLELKLNIVKIFAHKDSYLEKELIKNNIQYNLIENKTDFFEAIFNIDFDYFISNGLSYIVPVSKLKKKHQKFINIHPSLLPDLKGRNPINGALLYGKDAGVTCHYMDDGIDTGDIISQIKITYSQELDAALLYQLSFKLEGKVFELAYKNNFKSVIKQQKNENDIYYSEKNEDRIIDIEKDSIELIQKKISAFSAKGKGAVLDGHKVFKMDIIKNPEILTLINELKIEKYDNYILKNKDSVILRFMLN